MNSKLSKMQIERLCVNKVEINNRIGSKVNCVKTSAANTWDHELAKFKVCYELVKQGKSFLTECKFVDGGGRADVYCISTDTVIEILGSEKEKDCEIKSKKYPVQQVCMVSAIEINKGDTSWL